MHNIEIFNNFYDSPMRFGIIQCNKCRRAIGIELRFKSTTCPFCTQKLSIKPDSIKHRTASENELAQIISNLNRELDLQNTDSDPARSSGSGSGSGGFDFDVDNFGVRVKGAGAEVDMKHETSEVYEQLDPFKRIAIKYKNEPESIQLLEKLVITLGRELGEFTGGDLRKLLEACELNMDKTDEWLEQLKTLAVIFEPRSGHYRIIDE